MGRRMLGASGTWILAWVILTLVVHAPSSASAFRNIEKGKPCLDFSLKDLEGKTVTIADFKDKGLVICFWSAEKDNAIKSIEILQELYAAYRDKGLAVVGINTDQGMDNKVREVVSAKGITFPILLDGTRETYGKYGVFILPTMGLCGKDGNLMEPFSYSMHMKPELEGQIKVLLGLATAAAVEQSLAVSGAPAMSGDEKLVERHVGLAQTLIGQKMYDKALVELETAAKLKADDAALQNTMGKTLLLLARPQDAKAAFEKALAVNPMSRDAKEGLGEALVGTGEYDKALEFLTEALKLNPRPAPVHYRIGRVHEAKGDLEGRGGELQEGTLPAAGGVTVAHVFLRASVLIAGALLWGASGAMAYQYSVKVLAPSDKAILAATRVMLVGKVDDPGKTAEVKYLVDGQGLRPIAVKGGGFSQALTLAPGRHEIKVSAVGHNAHTITVTVETNPKDPDGVYRAHPGFDDGKCGDCHDARAKGKSVSDAKVCAAECHDDRKGRKFLHGPIGSGQCIPCHDPHGSPHKGFVKAEDRELCFLCHNAEDYEAHYRETKRLRCLNCHDPHGSDKKYIVK